MHREQTGTIATIDVGSRRFNHCYVGWNAVRMVWPRRPLRHPGTGATIDVVMDGAFSAIVVYTGDAIADALGVPWRSSR